METKVKKNPYGIIAGILFAILALQKLVSFIQFLSSNFNALDLLLIVAYAFVAVVLITEKRNKLAVAAFAVVALVSFISFISYFSLYSLLIFLAFLGITAVIGIMLTDTFPQYKELVKKVWFVPAVLYGVYAVRWLFIAVDMLVRWGTLSLMTSALLYILGAVALLFAALWAAYPNGLSKKETTYQAAENTGKNIQTTNAGETTNEAYCGLVKHILLLLFTFGIWNLIWIYRTTRYLNCVEDEEPRNPTNKLLLCMFVPFYSIYWVYKSAQRIDKLAAAKGISSDLSTLCLILAIFVGIIPPILMQEKINTIVTAGDAPVQQQTAVPHKPSKPDLGTAEELKTYKELLDEGVITQEEFDAKKKQLLGL